MWIGGLAEQINLFGDPAILSVPGADCLAALKGSGF
jgi:hypothetical protein